MLCSLHLLLFFVLPTSRLLFVASSFSCPPQKLLCGKTSIDIQYPFYTNSTANRCLGVHFIQCINLVPAVQFNGGSYLFPVRSISYPDKMIDVLDLRLSSFFRGSDCNFLYDFDNPLPGFNFTSVSLSQFSGESFFNCRESYEFSRDVFLSSYNLSLCRNYSLYYSGDSSASSSCSATRDLWFHWKLRFGEGRNSGETALLGAGFWPRWVELTCFSCRIAGSSCSNSCPAGKKKKRTGIEILIGATVAAGASVLLLACLIHHRCRRREQPQTNSASSDLLPDDSSKACLRGTGKEYDISCFLAQTHIFSYDELKEATNCFDAAMEIGGGGYGAVYSGKLRDGRAVAVKRLYETNFKRAEQFANEIAILSGLRHRNLVSLYGCAAAAHGCRELLLVYELLPNGTLADHLHGPLAGAGCIPWPLRLTIAVETASAIAYLHSVDPPIIHRDVKTGNILLDGDFHVKIADFGLSRLFPPGGATHISTAPQGTPGYLDPEYQNCYQLTDRSDVYSFGVVLAELLTSKPAVDMGRGREEINLSAMFVSRICKGGLDELIDGRLGFDSDEQTRRAVGIVAELTFRCLQADREMRPAIKEVLEVLRRVQSDCPSGEGGG
ncbi:putative serine/threonine-protein kinase [Apostasia shenzhenica]|uniref:Putative serine/threonine-protein kinase n=1 Tax=Apostasia shenzhenica TaxID=1088818 RepID=A0A2I0BA79_9ASPA|nr:putative serine/threonine-protein kinase [Apostasia shenzhenica]